MGKSDSVTQRCRGIVEYRRSLNHSGPDRGPWVKSHGLLVQTIFLYPSRARAGDREGRVASQASLRRAREDEVWTDLVEEPLDGLAVWAVTQLLRQPEDTGAAVDRYPDPPMAPVHLDVSVSGDTPALQLFLLSFLLWLLNSILRAALGLYLHYLPLLFCVCVWFLPLNVCRELCLTALQKKESKDLER